MSLDIAHLQEQVTFTNQAHLQAAPALEVLTKIGDYFQKLNPLNIIKGPRGGLWGALILMLLYVLLLIVCGFSLKSMREFTETRPSLIIVALQSKQKEGDVAAWWSRDQNLPHDLRVQQSAPL